MTDLSKDELKASVRRAVIEGRSMRDIKAALEKGDSLRYFLLCEHYGVAPENQHTYEQGMAEAERQGLAVSDLEEEIAKGLERKASTPVSTAPVTRNEERTTKFNYEVFGRELAAYEKINGKINLETIDPNDADQVDLFRMLLRKARCDYLTTGKEKVTKGDRTYFVGRRIEIEKAIPGRVCHVFKSKYEQLHKRIARGAVKL